MSKNNREKAIIALSQAYSQGDVVTTSRVEAILISDVAELPKELQKCLESWGSTPIDEPEFFALTQTAVLEDLKEAAVKDLDIDNFDALDVATLANRVYKQVTEKIDKDGKYKTTPNIDNVKLPRTSQIRKLKQMAQDKVDDEKIFKEIFKIAGVKEKDLIEWEASLVKDMITSFVQAVDKDVMGNYSDRTPFARYIKNV